MKTLVIGSAIVDIIIEVENLPKRKGDVISKNSLFVVGGCAYNVANILKLLDMQYTLFAPIGTGFFSKIIEKQLIEDEHKIVIKNDTMDNGYCIAFVEPDGERTFVTYSGLEQNFYQDWFNNINIEDYSNIYFEGYKMQNLDALKLIDYLLKLKDKKFYFAPGPVFNQIDKKILKKIMLLKPIIHLNEQEILEYTNETELTYSIKKLYLENKNLIIVTLGENGSISYDGKEFIKVEANKVKKIKDTSGAGDGHIGAFMFYFWKTNNIKEALKFANLISSQIVQIRGTKLNNINFLKELGENYE
ncbi:PfkB family carbohydrate kinase [Spiroplasma taiwanense]|uniref:Carbohydrate kinase PfkB domain-containing protein n=1 Tax=Spiroplasma taiwanense CT-1 TaxID=1276220 RepID=S5M013_9MOLU|nr:PfkB family carbohydrate kinase [Spiroplasma taiwanense]AGR41342.1 hypothetical protein STAIW_v1c07300 [Spiroplasma taiwanense CT-1]